MSAHRISAPACGHPRTCRVGIPCTRPGEPPDAPAPEDSTPLARYQRRRYYAAREAGLCLTCGTPTGGRCYCADCAYARKVERIGRST